MNLKNYILIVLQNLKTSLPLRPRRNKTFITAEITYSNGDMIHSMPPDELMKIVSEQVELAGLAGRKNLMAMDINWEPFVYPIQHTGYQEELANTRSVISRFQQLYSIGTGGDFNYADSQILFHKAFDTVEILTGKDSAYAQTVRKTQKNVMNPLVYIKGRDDW